MAFCQCVPTQFYNGKIINYFTCKDTEKLIYGTNHPQLKRSTHVTRVSHGCDSRGLQMLWLHTRVIFEMHTRVCFLHTRVLVYMRTYIRSTDIQTCSQLLTKVIFSMLNRVDGNENPSLLLQHFAQINTRYFIIFI